MCSRSPRREASALTATLPLWEISATAPGSRGATMSPHSAARAGRQTMPLPFGPQTGSAWRAAAATRRSWSSTPDDDSAKPAAKTTAPPQPSAPASSITGATSAAGIATTTASGASGSAASDGWHSSPCARSRRGLTA